MKGLNLVGDWSTGFRGSRSLQLGNRWASYAEIYRTQLWISVLVNKLARAEARLPYKTYTKDSDGGRRVDETSPFSVLMANPNPGNDDVFSWREWIAATEKIYGEAFLLKIRDKGGRPVRLVRAYPTCMTPKIDESDGEIYWDFMAGRVRIENIPCADVVHFRNYNPEPVIRGLSNLEPLRATLENEDAARRATSSFWKRGARPGTVLMHPGELSEAAGNRLVKQWDQLSAGADQNGTTMLLEEGTRAERMQLSAEESQYIETRKLNREEACAIYDVPPPVVHILDRATFSNITEQMRSMYRDTMAPILGKREKVIHAQIRDSVRRGGKEPDFGPEVYGEYLLDEVLRGDFEARTTAFASAIQSGQMTPAEARAAENRPFIEGSDKLLINSALVPIQLAADAPAIPGTDGREEPVQLSLQEVRTLMGRLGRLEHPEQIQPKALALGMRPEIEAFVTEQKSTCTDLVMFKDALRGARGEE